MLRNTNLYLIGMMGAGKTTVGKHLAKELGYHFFDTDALLSQISGQTIPDLFSQGEEQFRQLETQVLAQLAPHTRLVIATGGGIVLASHNWAYLHSGVVVWLDVPASVLWQRVKTHVAERPLLQHRDETYFAHLLQERTPLYQQADVIIPGSDPPERVSAQVLHALQQRIAADQNYIKERVRPD